MTDRTTLVLDGAETLVLMRVIAARMEVLEVMPRSAEVLAELRTLWQVAEQLGSQITAHAARERAERKAQWN